MVMRSTVPSVWPRRVSTPPGRARSGNTWPGRQRSTGMQWSSIAVRIVVTRSAAETPVVTPLRASIDTVNAVWLALVLCSVIGGRSRLRSFSSVRHRHTIPLHSLISIAICGTVIDPAGKMISPSFSRFSSSTRRTPPPSRRSEIARSTRSKGVPKRDRIDWFIIELLAVRICRVHDERCGRAGRGAAGGTFGPSFSPIRTFTVGPGISPALLTPHCGRSRAWAHRRHYRRWGISPRPENNSYPEATRIAVCQEVSRVVFAELPGGDSRHPGKDGAESGIGVEADGHTDGED